MKKVSLLILIVIPFIFSCSEEEFDSGEMAITINEQESTEKGIAFRTYCDITGPTCADPGTTAQFSYTKNFTTSNITWFVQSGNVTITGGQGTSTVTVQFASNFSGGTISALGTGSGGVLCSDIMQISKCVVPSCTPPTLILITQTGGTSYGDIFTFEADPNGSTDTGTYQWSTSPGASIISGQGTSNVSIQSPLVPSPLFPLTVTVNHVNTCDNTSVSAFMPASVDSRGIEMQ